MGLRIFAHKWRGGHGHFLGSVVQCRYGKESMGVFLQGLCRLGFWGLGVWVMPKS